VEVHHRTLRQISAKVTEKNELRMVYEPQRYHEDELLISKPELRAGMEIWAEPLVFI